MYQTRKANQWYFGMKAHIVEDKDSGLVHSVSGTAANVADVTQTEHLLHGEEAMVFAENEGGRMLIVRFGVPGNSIPQRAVELYSTERSAAYEMAENGGRTNPLAGLTVSVSKASFSVSQEASPERLQRVVSCPYCAV